MSHCSCSWFGRDIPVLVQFEKICFFLSRVIAWAHSSTLIEAVAFSVTLDTLVDCPVRAAERYERPSGEGWPVRETNQRHCIR